MHTDVHILHFTDTGIVIITMHSLNWLHRLYDVPMLAWDGKVLSVAQITDD